MDNNKLQVYFEEKLAHAKIQFERTIDCKHTEFDDLYPYMTEQPQFFWYKRYVAWQELLTIVQTVSDLELNWQQPFTDKQIIFVEAKVMDAKVLDNWYEQQQEEVETEQSSQKE
ncbi:hypothetical protein AJ85_13810 [Alkalihalobacillus alcalophilus ATCC 27647 = CGMCC 1.3604]|uniref:Uncharacterized protein n=1 Tax=Alkalihalobacillus alcalophilus ATCC 27647 = CGMCC 1.3604 TaxID=1218173 RepID=A0A094WNB5_ALKAL|nr:hypothetical protein [Alkalihalobacillus alcalophilus]KGA97468.1 hypothetical protein BALCAV_0209870 [Alkalihalobacillus alcalophilus ATCC 27647 = CGMCC 1.3604]MED1563290.1 hypothetical protein [Alkalihalobacillus alcalophilus]THG92247.1 hypothetical protein AJ85_13810 [Alkalihalobacillus alcalophilus ATCC 27647 = CGMCC 1.3604]